MALAPSNPSPPHYTYWEAAMSLAELVERDDRYTARHSRSIVPLAVHVADELGLDEVGRRRTKIGALLHDAGKISVPKSIINKPGPLSPQEVDIVRTHAVEGQRLLEHFGGELAEVGPIVRSSHEHWDGGGYPDGLAGVEIPVEARIVAGCDAFGAMTTDRPYRRAMSAEVALRELREHSGSQFDPAVVSALVLHAAP